MAELIGLAEYKTYKGIRSPEKDDQLRYIVDAVNTLVKNYCNRTFVDYYNLGSEKIEYFDGTETVKAFLEEIPLVSVVEVLISTDGGVTNTTLVENTDYFVDLDEGSVQTASGNYFTPGTSVGHHSLSIKYTGGYSSAPSDLKIACLDLVSYYQNEEYTPKKSMSRSGEVTQYITNLLPPHIKRVMDLYRIIP